MDVANRGGPSDGSVDLFISYTRADQDWAEWLADMFERRGLSTVYQYRDFGVGESFRSHIHNSLTGSTAVVLILSPDYERSDYTLEEWTSAQESKKPLIPIRVTEYDPQGLLADRAYIDIVGLEHDEAEAAIMDRIERSEIQLRPGSARDRFRRSMPGYPARQHAVLAAPAELMGRDELLQDISTALRRGGPVGLIPDVDRAAGRSSAGIAAEFVRRRAVDFDQVCWMNAEPIELLELEFRRIGRELGLPPLRRGRDEIYAHLRERFPGRALVVFSGAPERAAMDELLPPDDVACLVITTSDTYRDNAVRLGLLTEQQARTALAGAAKTDESDVEQVRQLLPLAPSSIALAARWFRATEGRPDEYRSKLEEKPRSADDPGEAVRQVTLDHLAELAPDALALLRLLSRTLPVGFPLAAFEYATTSGDIDPSLHPVLVAHDARANAIDVLDRFGVLHEGVGLIVAGGSVTASAAARGPAELMRDAQLSLARTVDNAMTRALEDDDAVLAAQLAPHAHHLARRELPAELIESLGFGTARYMARIGAHDLARAELERLHQADTVGSVETVLLEVDLDILAQDLGVAAGRLDDMLAEERFTSGHDRRVILTRLGRVRSLAGDHDGASSALAEARELAATLEDAREEQLAVLYERLHAERRAGDLPAALRTAEERHELARAYGADSPTRLDALGDLGSARLGVGGDPATALTELREARDGLARRERDPQVADLSLDLAQAYGLGSGDGERPARNVLGRAAVIRAAREGPSAPGLVPILERLADCHEHAGDRRRSVVLRNRAARLAGADDPIEDPPIARPHRDILRVLENEHVVVIGPGLTDRVIGNRREMARRWAEDDTWRYPMAEHHKEDLPHIAQYMSVRIGPTALRNNLREYFLDELRQRYDGVLPEPARGDPEPDLIRLIPPLLHEAGRVSRWCDPFEYHSVLARLDTEIYITTGASDLLEDALRDVGKNPTTVVCNWLDESHPGAHESYYEVKPSVRRPMVLHLFGSFTRPGSVLLAERDYLDFVIRYASSQKSVPHKVEHALVSKSLLFVGFDLDDWDFNVLLQGFIDQPGELLSRGLPHAAVNVTEKPQWRDEQGAKEYLETLMSAKRPTSIVWQDLDDLMVELGHELDRRRGLP